MKRSPARCPPCLRRPPWKNNERITKVGHSISPVSVPALTGNITADLLLVLALFACLAWAARRGLLAAREAGWIGTALVFFGVSLVFNAVLTRNGQTYPHQVAKLVGLSALMVLPLLLSLGYGVYALSRSLASKTLNTVQINGLALQLVQGSPAAFQPALPLDALLLPTTTDLAMRGGSASLLRTFGGPAIEPEALALAPLPVGKAIGTTAGALPVARLIHAPLRAPGSPVTESDAKRALDAAFQCAKQSGARRVALPPFGVQPGKLTPSAAAFLTVAAALRARKDFDLIAIVVFDRSLLRAFQSEFGALAQKYPAPPVA